MSLRPEIAQPHDAESMAELHFLSHTVSFANFASPEWVKSRERDDYLKQWNTFLQDAQSDDRSQAWKVSANNAVVGMVKVSPVSDTEAHLSSMHVHPDFHRQGIGSLLMNAASSFIRETGFSKATLGVIQANMAARAIYERNGWKVKELHETGTEGVPIAVYCLGVKSAGRG